MPHPIYLISVAQKPNTYQMVYFWALFFINLINVGGSIADWMFEFLSVRAFALSTFNFTLFSTPFFLQS